MDVWRTSKASPGVELVWVGKFVVESTLGADGLDMVLITVLLLEKI